MSLYIQNVFLDKADRVNANPSSQDFVRAFLMAANETLMDISTNCHVTPSTVTAPDEEIEELDEKYLPALSAGIDWYLHLRSAWSVDNPSVLRGAYDAALVNASSIYYGANTIAGRRG